MFSDKVEKITVRAKLEFDNFVYIQITLNLPLTSQERGLLMMEDWYRNKIMYTKTMKERGTMKFFCKLLRAQYKRFTTMYLIECLKKLKYCVCSGNIWNNSKGENDKYVMFEITDKEFISEFINNILRPVVFREYTTLGKLYEFIEGL